MTNTLAPADDAPSCAAPDPSPRPPAFEMPPLACDCHAHVCGPPSRYPYYARRVYSPPDALPSHYARVLATLGIERAVLVQPSFYHTDNAALLAAIKTCGRGFRGVAVVAADAGERELRELHAAGVRGVRVNIVDTRDDKGVLPLDALQRLARRIQPLGWHMEFLMHVDEFPDLDRALADFPVDVVFGHLGYVRADKGIATPGFQALLRLMQGGRAWVKLTGPYRISTQALPHADTHAYARALLETAPDRVLWGTDWPHVMAKWTIGMPNDGDLCDLLVAWAPSAALRKRILVDNPARLYGYE